MSSELSTSKRKKYWTSTNSFLYITNARSICSRYEMDMVGIEDQPINPLSIFPQVIIFNSRCDCHF